MPPKNCGVLVLLLSSMAFASPRDAKELRHFLEKMDAIIDDLEGLKEKYSSELGMRGSGLNEKGRCESGWLEFPAKCFYMFKASGTWNGFDAEKYCNRRGGHLFPVKSHADREIVFTVAECPICPEKFILLQPNGRRSLKFERSEFIKVPKPKTHLVTLRKKVANDSTSDEPSNEQIDHEYLETPRYDGSVEKVPKLRMRRAILRKNVAEDGTSEENTEDEYLDAPWYDGSAEKVAEDGTSEENTEDEYLDAPWYDGSAEKVPKLRMRRAILRESMAHDTTSDDYEYDDKEYLDGPWYDGSIEKDSKLRMHRVTVRKNMANGITGNEMDGYARPIDEWHPDIDKKVPVYGICEKPMNN